MGVRSEPAWRTKGLRVKKKSTDDEAMGARFRWQVKRTLVLVMHYSVGNLEWHRQKQTASVVSSVPN
jgi:hypothetical protein